jgi:hypothetical protein
VFEDKGDVISIKYNYFYRILCKTMSCHAANWDVSSIQKSENFMRDHSMTIHVKIDFNQNSSF